ncbi:MAG: nucleotidyl transferase AbiEii/AbiGii toxin family protein [Candidatus Zixiibacteriota bacterium]
MKNWLKLPIQRQIDLFNQLNARTGIPHQAIEKDAWVTLALRMIFTSKISEYLVFKGGTSLSKVYKLIERFSEDIDLAIDRKYLGFEGDLTKGEIRRLRRKSHDFTSSEMVEILRTQLDNHEIDTDLYEIIVDNTNITDQDPEIVKINYKSVFEVLPYLTQNVTIEIGARSLIEPFEQRKIQSIIRENYPDMDFSEDEFIVNTVIPEKTFLEKLILLHEEFQKSQEKVRYQRMSRHLYDIGQIMNTDYGKRALNNTNLFNEIVQHRKKFTPMKNVAYEKLTLQNLKIIPHGEFLELYRKDYIEMQGTMIYRKSLGFDSLIEQLKLIGKTPSR